MELNKTIARKVIKTVDAGLSKGLGDPKPGQMCVEAAVNFALGLPHGDNPKCVGSEVRQYKITLNDYDWSSNGGKSKSRAKVNSVRKNLAKARAARWKNHKSKGDV